MRFLIIPLFLLVLIPNSCKKTEQVQGFKPVDIQIGGPVSLSAFGFGDSPNKSVAVAKANTLCMSNLAAMAEGYTFRYSKRGDDVEIHTETAAEIEGVRVGKPIFINENPAKVVVVCETDTLTPKISSGLLIQIKTSGTLHLNKHQSQPIPDQITTEIIGTIKEFAQTQEFQGVLTGKLFIQEMKFEHVPQPNLLNINMTLLISRD